MPQFRNPFIPQITKDITFDQAFKTGRRLTLVYILSNLVYVVVAVLLVRSVPVAHMGFVGFPDATYLNFVILAAAVSLVLLIVILLVLPRFISPQALLARKQIETVDNLGYELLQAQLMRITLAQAIAIFGLMLFLFNGHWLHMIPFALLSILLLTLKFPRKEQWDEAKRLFETHQLLRG